MGTRPHENMPMAMCTCDMQALMGAVLEVTWHDDGYQNLICEADSKRAGHINGGVSQQHLLQGQSSYLCSSAPLPASMGGCEVCTSTLGWFRG